LLLVVADLIQSLAYLSAKDRQVPPHGLCRDPLGAQPGLLVMLGRQHAATPLDLRPPLPQLVEADDLRLVGVDEADLLAVQPLERGLPPPALLPHLGRSLRPLGDRLELRGERLGVVQEPTDVPPHGLLQALRWHHRPRAPGLVRGADGLAPAALVVPVRAS